MRIPEKGLFIICHWHATQLGASGNIDQAVFAFQRLMIVKQSLSQRQACGVLWWHLIGRIILCQRAILAVGTRTAEFHIRVEVPETSVPDEPI